MVSRRLWLVLIVFGVTTASAIWAVSRQRIYYQSHLSLQVNDPAQPARGLTPGRISGLDIFVDPIESEIQVLIQVLRSTPIAAAVVDSLGLGLRPASEDWVRSDLFRDVRVEQGAPEGRLELVYDAAGRRAQLRAPDGSVLGIPVLGVIPRLRRVATEQEGPSEPRGTPMLVPLDHLDPAAEAYRNLRMNMMFMGTEGDPVRSVLFSGPGLGEGKSITAVNFAVMLAQQGQRVLLVDADLRRPALHRSLDLLREPGLTNLLVGDATVREAVRPSVLPNLDVLPSWPFPPNPSELLGSKAMQRLLEEFEGKYNQVIIDSPPVLAVTDAAILAVHTDGVVLRSGETEQRAAECSVEQLRRLGVRVFGALLNEVSATTTEEGYDLQYYYAYPAHRRGRGEVGEATRGPVSSAFLVPVAVTALPDHPHGTTR